nr:MAG TPA: hypothetical protein [Caudoviricetes sp.]
MTEASSICSVSMKCIFISFSLLKKVFKGDMESFF